MAVSADINVVHYDTDHVANPYPHGELPWQVYHTVRNAVFRTCRSHGPTGAMAECPIHYDRDIDDPYGIEGWSIGDAPCDYFVVDDQYNHEQYLYMEIYATERLSLEWLTDVMATLRNYPGWGVAIKNLNKGYILVFADRVMVNGPIFARRRSIESVLKAARRNLGGTPEWEKRQATKKMRRDLLELRSPWATTIIGIVVALVLGLIATLMGHGRLVPVIAVTVGLVLWTSARVGGQHRRIFGDWHCSIGVKERCIELREGEMAMVTVDGCVTGMDCTIDWNRTPPTLTLQYMGFSRHDESHQPLEAFDVLETVGGISTWTTKYAFRFLSDNEIQLAPLGTDFSASDAGKHPIYKRRVTASEGG